MGGFHYRRSTLSTKHVLRQPWRQFPVDLFGITHTAAQHNNVRVQYIDNRRQATGEVIQVLVQSFSSPFVGLKSVIDDIASRLFLTGQQFVRQ